MQRPSEVLSAKFRHTNLVAKNWRVLSGFYERVFGCIPLDPERDFGGDWLDDLTGLEDAWICGRHLRLPGCGDNGPTLEIFQYRDQPEGGASIANRPGFAHIAFEVDDVESALEAVLAEGGGVVGKTVTIEVADAGRITLVYATDPEGNIVELQHWH